jgi:hypothetical protein
MANRLVIPNTRERKGNDPISHLVWFVQFECGGVVGFDNFKPSEKDAAGRKKVLSRKIPWGWGLTAQYIGPILPYSFRKER